MNTQCRFTTSQTQRYTNLKCANLNSGYVQVFAIELVTFAVDFIQLAVEFDVFAVEFVGFAVEFVALALQFVALAIELEYKVIIILLLQLLQHSTPLAVGVVTLKQVTDGT